jgi:endonuclease/exonuclease/phosphatase family metal-dependent hydrolase
MKHLYRTQSSFRASAVVRSISLILTLCVSEHLVFAEQSGIGGKRDIDVMTLNLYVGSTFDPLTTLNRSDPNYGMKFLTGVATIYSRILASNFSARADVIAREVARRGPDVIALQEVTQIRHQSPGDAIVGGTVAATDVVLDYLETLLASLEFHGAHYAVAAMSQDLDVEVPLITASGNFDDLRLTDREVILVRADLPPGYLRGTNPQHGNYAAALPLPIGISVVRGWCSIDLQVRGRVFRVINTHLEEALPESLPDFQGFQAYELLTGPANTTLPVVLAGDFNSDADGNYGPSVYPLLTSFGGFSDAWSVARPGEPGLTWGHDEFLADPAVLPTLRIDYVLYRGSQFSATDAETIGWMIRSIPPLWFSDHAAILVKLGID